MLLFKQLKLLFLCELSFKCINQSNESEYAIALGATVNLLNEISNSSLSNLNSQDLILLKAITSNVAQEALNVNSNHWLILKNKTIRFNRLDNGLDDLQEGNVSSCGVKLGHYGFVSCWTENKEESVPLWIMNIIMI